jgi:hypothetical protein
MKEKVAYPNSPTFLRADTHKNSIAEQKMVLWCTMRARRENQGVI